MYTFYLYRADCAKVGHRRNGHGTRGGARCGCGEGLHLLSVHLLLCCSAAVAVHTSSLPPFVFWLYWLFHGTVACVLLCSLAVFPYCRIAVLTYFRLPRPPSPPRQLLASPLMVLRFLPFLRFSFPVSFFLFPPYFPCFGSYFRFHRNHTKFD